MNTNVGGTDAYNVPPNWFSGGTVPSRPPYSAAPVGIRTASKEDLGVSSAELVYGSPLTVPGDFFMYYVQFSMHSLNELICTHWAFEESSYLSSTSERFWQPLGRVLSSLRFIILFCLFLINVLATAKFCHLKTKEKRMFIFKIYRFTDIRYLRFCWT